MIRSLVCPISTRLCSSLVSPSVGTQVAISNLSTALIGYTTDGTYPAGVTNGDVLVASVATTALPTAPLGWTQISTGAIGVWGNYFSYQRTATGALSGTVFSGNEFNLMMLLRGVSAANLISAFSASSSWASLSGLTNNSNIYAVGYTDTAGVHGGATLAGTFTTQTNTAKNVLATLTNKNSGTTFAYTGCSNNGTTVAMCFSYGIA
jgi:hypothetical protein